MAHKKRVVEICSYLNSCDVITMSANGSICLWAVESGVRLRKSLDYGDQISVATFNRESLLIAIGLHESGTVKVLDAETGSTARVFPDIVQGENDFTLLQFSNNSAYLLTADTSGIIRVSVGSLWPV